MTKKRVSLMALLLSATMLISVFGTGCAAGIQSEMTPEEQSSVSEQPETMNDSDGTNELGEDLAAWTVMFYLCGSDLESKYGYATGNLEEIAQCKRHTSILGDIAREYGDEVDDSDVQQPEQVHVLIQTGGSKTWRARGELNMNISSDCLQRWYYDANKADASPEEMGEGFLLKEELPLASMSDPGTLTDFIRWSAEMYPAEKYALVLWDHGGGAKGIIIDELYDGDMMRLEELHNALADANVPLEVVLFDACLMANLETACAISDSARWMCASEEVVAGKGTAIGDWLQRLYYMPECDGERLCRWICDMTQTKYANEDDEQAQQLMTWSVIDLSQIERVELAFDRFFAMVGQVYARYPKLMSLYAQRIIHAEDFGVWGDNLWDLAGVFYDLEMSSAVDMNIQRDMLDALTDAVTYSVRGMGRSAARGLSFCYAVDFDSEELSIYAQSCPSPHYLAFLDAITPWTAPDWVYEFADRLPEIDTIEEYEVTVEKHVQENGTPSFSFVGDSVTGVSSVRFHVYRPNEDTGQTVSLGVLPAYDDEGEFIVDAPIWPSIEGVLCNAEVTSMGGTDITAFLFNVPIQIGSDVWYLRCGYDMAVDAYTVYGLWEGFDSDSTLFNRNVKPLSQLAGQEYRLMYPVDGIEDHYTRFESSKKLTMYRSLELEDMPLPEGQYYLQFIVFDLFMRPMELERIEVSWDGETLSFPENTSWSGTETLHVSDKYW